MIKSWLKHNKVIPCSYSKFNLTTLDEIAESNPSLDRANLVQYLSELLVKAHSNPRMIATDLHELQQLLSDASEVGLDVIRDYAAEKIGNYLDQYVLPTKPITRIGNFSEIIAVQCMVDFENYSIPLYKLRYREKRDWAMRLTDMFLIQTQSNGKLRVCYGEVKTRSTKTYTKKVKRVGVEAYESLKKDDALANPEILPFVRRILYEQENYEYADLLGQVQSGLAEYDKHFALFLVHDLNIWNDEILDELEKQDIDKRLVDLSVFVLRVSDLRSLIDTTYGNAWQGVVVNNG